MPLPFLATEPLLFLAKAPTTAAAGRLRGRPCVPPLGMAPAVAHEGLSRPCWASFQTPEMESEPHVAIVPAFRGLLPWPSWEPLIFSSLYPCTSSLLPSLSKSDIINTIVNVCSVARMYCLDNCASE